MSPIPVVEDPRITKCLNAKRESKAIEFKEQFLPTDTRQALEVLKDIVAIANSGGGALAIGINNAGETSGFDVKSVLDYDHAKYCDLIKKYTMQNFADFEVVEAKKNGHSVALFLINPPDSPLVFEKPGTYAVDPKHQQTVFAQGTIYFRHGAKSESGTTDDVRKFIEKRVREMHEQLVKGLRKVSEAPRGSQLQVVPSGTRAVGPERAVPVRLTTNPNAQRVLVTDRHEIFPYRQKDLIAKLKEVLPTGSVANTYDLQAINRVYKIADKDNLSWHPPFLSRLYSDAFVEWIVDKISKEKNFLQDTRDRLYEINLKNQSGRH
jgi:hypothetical protein